MKLITKAIENMMNKYPLYSQDGKGKAAKVLFKAFNPYGSETFYVLEAGKPTADGDRELYALMVNGYEKEYGYLMLSDLLKVKVRGWMPFERDLYFKGTVADALEDAGLA